MWLNQFAFRYSLKQRKYNERVLTYLKTDVTVRKSMVYFIDSLCFYFWLHSGVQRFLLSICSQEQKHLNLFIFTETMVVLKSKKWLSIRNQRLKKSTSSFIPYHTLNFPPLDNGNTKILLTLIVLEHRTCTLSIKL